jgi:hypothetical protein
LVATKKEVIGRLLEKKKWPISPNMTVVWGWVVGLGNCWRCPPAPAMGSLAWFGHCWNLAMFL